MSDPTQTLVMKFGGTSIGTPEMMAQVIQIVRQTRAQWPRVVVVTSALATVTNLLLDSAVHASRGDPQLFYQGENRLRQLHYSIAESLVGDITRRVQLKQEIDYLIASFANLCQAITVLGEATPRVLDAVAALGERMSVRLMASALETEGVPAQIVEATRLIVTDNHFQNAHPDFEATKSKTCVEFLEKVETHIHDLPPELAAIHADIYANVRRGDPTPFKSFRRNEYLTTIRCFGQLEDNSPLEALLAQEILVTQEVRAVVLGWQKQGALLFGLSDKPDEAATPPPELATQGYLPIHQAITHSAGE